MHFDPTIQAGSIVSAAAFVLSALLIYRGWVRWQAQTEAQIESLREHKVNREDCLRSHGDVVTTAFCREQHDTLTKETRGVAAELHKETLDVAKDVADKFTEMAEKVVEIATDQHWIKDSLRVLHSNTASVANPHPEPLPPDPRERGD